MNINELKTAARILTEGTDNVEYVRGICELIADVDGKLDTDHAERSLQIARELGIDIEVIGQMY